MNASTWISSSPLRRWSRLCATGCTKYNLVRPLTLREGVPLRYRGEETIQRGRTQAFYLLHDQSWEGSKYRGPKSSITLIRGHLRGSVAGFDIGCFRSAGMGGTDRRGRVIRYGYYYESCSICFEVFTQGTGELNSELN